MTGADHKNAREEFTNIRVTRDSRWFTGPKEIINYKVISHFKQHLFRDAKGIYIYQTFRQFAEKGYISVEGPLLAVFRVESDRLILDSLDEIPLSETELLLNSEDQALYIKYPRLGCYATVPAAVAPDFSALLTETGDEVQFQGRPITALQIERWVE